MIEASVNQFCEYTRGAHLYLLSSFYSPFYTEGGGISIDQSCSREGKMKKCKKKEARVARARQWEKGKKKKVRHQVGRRRRLLCCFQFARSHRSD